MRNGIYNGIGGIVRTALALAAIPLVIRLVGSAEYGLWSLAAAILGVVALAEAGLSGSTTVFAARDLAKNDTRGLAQTFWITLFATIALATGAALLLWLGSDFIAGLFKKLTASERLTVSKALKISSLVVYARLLQQIFVGIQQAFQRYGALNLIQTLQSAGTSLGMIFFAWKGGGTLDFMILNAIVGVGALLANAAFAWRLLERTKLVWCWNWTKCGEIFRFSFFNWLAYLGTVLFTNCDRLIVGGLLNLSTLGVYSAITGIAAQINVISAAPVQPLLASMSWHWLDKADHGQARRHLRFACEINAFLALGIGATIYALAPALLGIVLRGAPDATAVFGLKCAAIIYACYSMNAVGYFVLPAIGEMKRCMTILFSGGVLALLLIAIGTWLWGFIGAVLGNGGFIVTLLMTFRTMKKMGIPGAEWMSWIRFPAAWFVLTLLAGSLFPNCLSFEFSLMSASGFILACWPLRRNLDSIRQGWQKFIRQSRVP